MLYRAYARKLRSRDESLGEHLQEPVCKWIHVSHKLRWPRSAHVPASQVQGMFTNLDWDSVEKSATKQKRKSNGPARCGLTSAHTAKHKLCLDSVYQGKWTGYTVGSNSWNWILLSFYKFQDCTMGGHRIKKLTTYIVLCISRGKSSYTTKFCN